MNEVDIINDSCKEVAKIKKLYWIFYNNLTDVQKAKREGQWRIDDIALSGATTFKVFNVDVTDWTWDEDIKLSANGPACGKKISGFMPKLNEFAESYFNEMSRRNLVIAIETFDDSVYLFGGASCKSKFSFSKSINNRNGYNLEFTNEGDESSLIINDTDHFPAPAVITTEAYLDVNGVPFTSILLGNTFDLVVKDSDGVVVGSKVGSEWIVPAGPTLSGVSLQWPTGQQYPSYRTGDEGSRLQAGFFDYTRPLYPLKTAELDMTAGANFWFKLKNALTVNGVSSTTRFVDVDGGQTWSATNDKDRITIDKLTGLGFYRKLADLGGNKNWNTCIDDALSFSTVVNSITYSNWYLISMEEIQAIFGECDENGSGNIIDLISTNVILNKNGGSNSVWTSTTQLNSGGANAYYKGWNPSTYLTVAGKSATIKQIIVFDAKSLIS